MMFERAKKEGTRLGGKMRAFSFIGLFYGYENTICIILVSLEMTSPLLLLRPS